MNQIEVDAMREHIRKSDHAHLLCIHSRDTAQAALTALQADYAKLFKGLCDAHAHIRELEAAKEPTK